MKNEKNKIINNYNIIIYNKIYNKKKEKVMIRIP